MVAVVVVGDAEEVALAAVKILDFFFICAITTASKHLSNLF